MIAQLMDSIKRFQSIIPEERIIKEYQESKSQHFLYIFTETKMHHKQTIEEISFV